ENIDVSANQQAAQEMTEKSGQMGVPVLDINGEIVVGFDKDKISQLLGL
ncbi:MAG: NrdH-redoxin, partial [Candidatus Omnitrophica bacterium]|nr:NrdH-redoxin [Candidatus Omnitrophota bacterium]